MKKLIMLCCAFFFSASVLAFGLGGLKLPSTSKPKTTTTTTTSTEEPAETSYYQSIYTKTLPINILVPQGKTSQEIVASIRATLDSKLKVIDDGLAYQNKIDDVKAILKPKYGTPLEWNGGPSDRKLYWIFKTKNQADKCHALQFVGNERGTNMHDEARDCRSLFKDLQNFFEANFSPIKELPAN